jgi:hypothetical protein
MDRQHFTTMAHKFQSVLDEKVLNERGQALGLVKRQRRVLPTSQREFPSSIAYRLPYMKEEGTPYLGGDHVNNPCLAPCRSPTRPIGGPV